MGLLSSLGRAARYGAREMNFEAPLLAMGAGGISGGAIGAAANPDDPMGGAMTGAMIGAGITGGPSVGRVVGRAAQGFTEPRRIANLLARIAIDDGPEAVSEHLRLIIRADPALGAEVRNILRSPEVQRHIILARGGVTGYGDMGSPQH